MIHSIYHTFFELLIMNLTAAKAVSLVSTEMIYTNYRLICHP